MSTTNETNSIGKNTRGRRLAIYHPNGAGTGAAMQLEPRLNRQPGDRYDCFFMEMAVQKSSAESQDGKTVPASFDWARKLTVKLDFEDLCEILAVLEGRQSRVGGQRNGMFHASNGASTVITFQKNTEKEGYLLGLSRKGQEDKQPVRVNMLLSEPESVGLRSILQTGLFFLLFHAHLFPGRHERRWIPGAGDRPDAVE